MQARRETDKIHKCILEVNPETGTPIVEVDEALVRSMKPHQVEGVKFLYRTMIESINKVTTGEPGLGAILAHCMGLGKTFLSICFLHTLQTHRILRNYMKKTIVLCPCNVVLNWAREFDKWINKNEGVREKLIIHEFCRMKTLAGRMKTLEAWNESGGVLIMSYSMFRIMTSTMKASEETAKRLPQLLHNPGPDLVVCDEGHTLKSAKAQISVTMNMIRTQRRLVLTGTPLQNNMTEYHCMVNFVRPDSLGTLKEFKDRFVDPIVLGQKADADKEAVRLMKTRVHILNKLIGDCVHRCDYTHLAPYLPPKFEYVISINLSALQMKLYRQYLKHIGVNRNTTREDLKRRVFLKDYQVLKMVWSHPCLIVESEDRQEGRRLRRAKKRAENGTVEDPLSEGCRGASEKLTENYDSSDNEQIDEFLETQFLLGAGMTGDTDSKEEQEEPWWSDHVSPEGKGITNLELSSKFVVAFEILKECERIKDKVILFSTSLLTLNLFERQLQAQQQGNAETVETAEHVRKWERGLDYFRVDGTTGVGLRKECIDKFNDPSNERARLILVSTKAGGTGANMIGANRIIVVDASWNPSDDTQAVFRAYRFGQTKPVYVYRLLSHATMEEKIYHRQVDKIALAFRVVDEKNLERHFKGSDLKALYEFKPSRRSRKTMMLPKDRLLADLLIKCKNLIKGYHEHDALLRNDVEDELTEGERKQAWMEYENEHQDDGALQNVEPARSLHNFDFQQQLRSSYRRPVETQTSEEMLKSIILYDRPRMDPREIFKDIKSKYPNADQLTIAIHSKHAVDPGENVRPDDSPSPKRSARANAKQDFSRLKRALRTSFKHD